MIHIDVPTVKEKLEQDLKSKYPFYNLSNIKLFFCVYPDVVFKENSFSMSIFDLIGKPLQNFHDYLDNNPISKNKLELKYSNDILCFTVAKNTDIYSFNFKIKSTYRQEAFSENLMWHWYTTGDYFYYDLASKWLIKDFYSRQKHVLLPEHVFANYNKFCQEKYYDHFVFEPLNEDLLKCFFFSKKESIKFVVNPKIKLIDNYHPLINFIAAGCVSAINPNFISSLGYHFNY